MEKHIMTWSYWLGIVLAALVFSGAWRRCLGDGVSLFSRQGQFSWISFVLGWSATLLAGCDWHGMLLLVALAKISGIVAGRIESNCAVGFRVPSCGDRVSLYLLEREGVGLAKLETQGALERCALAS